MKKIFILLLIISVVFSCHKKKKQEKYWGVDMNKGIEVLFSSYSISLFDSTTMNYVMFSSFSSSGKIVIGSEKLNLVVPEQNINSFFQVSKFTNFGDTLVIDAANDAQQIHLDVFQKTVDFLYDGKKMVFVLDSLK